MRFKVPARQPESFKGSALYLAGRIKGLSPDRVEFVETRNIHTDDPRAAAALMEATASKSVRCQQPAYHFMITFDPKDAEAGKVTPE
ncbi:relaxase/mobilization nuclease domain-containing protein, partial [Escherichia coli]|uniref:relaxase/mobilization nuclease domain-containing protein n=2 Tax=Pseudomonadota TaxID=1224 RepID=UPI00194DC356